MTTSTSDLRTAPDESGWRRVARSRFARSRPVVFVLGVVRQGLLEPIAQGRLRDVDWPYGLKALVGLAYGMFALAALGVIFSGPVRTHARLVISGSTTVGLPAGMVWPMLLLLSFGAATLLSAAIHGPWWLKVLGTTSGLMIMGAWSLRTTGGGASALGWLALAVVAMVGLVVFVVLRRRRRFAWWELAVSWILLGAAMIAGTMESRFAKQFGFDFNIVLLQQTAALLGFLALPTAMVAGASVAEVSVRATVAAVRQAQRLSHHRWPFVILLVVIVVRGVQTVRQLQVRDPVAGSWWVAVLPAVIIVAAFAGLGFLVVRTSRRRGAELVVSELSEHLGSVGLAVAAALVASQLPLQVALVVLQVATSLFPHGAAATAPFDLSFVQASTDPLRVVVGGVLVVLAIRAVRRDRPGRALLLGCVGIMLLALARNLVLGDAAAAQIDPDILNLVGSVAVAVVLVVELARRRLDGQRALAYAGVLILSALFSSRDFISDPVGSLLGFSGAALLLFGLTWDLLTGSDWGNGDSRRFPRPTRVLLMLTNSVLTMTVLAYAALIRDGSTTIYLDPFAEFGDLIFGTALVAAAVIAVFDAAGRRVPVD